MLPRSTWSQRLSNVSSERRRERERQALRATLLAAARCLLREPAYLAFGRQQPEAYQVIFLQRPDFLLKWKAGTQQLRA